MAKSIPLPADIDTGINELERALTDGKLERLPKHPARRDIVLAVVCHTLHRRYPYTEVELRGDLEDGLRTLNAEVDHVTCRRYAVDCGFLKRDRAGTRYYLNYLRMTETLTENALDQIDKMRSQALARHQERLEKKAAARAAHLNQGAT